MPKEELKHPGNAPKIPVKVKELKTKRINREFSRTIIPETSRGNYKLLTLLKNVPPDADVDNLRVRVSVASAGNSYSRRVTSTLIISEESVGPNPLYQVAIDKYDKAVVRFEKKTKEWKLATKAYEVQEAAKMQKQWARRRASMEKKIKIVEGAS